VGRQHREPQPNDQRQQPDGDKMAVGSVVCDHALCMWNVRRSKEVGRPKKTCDESLTNEYSVI